MFEIEPERLATLQALHAEGRGIILVTGHHGNWEAGAVMMTRFLRLPLTIVAMREANPEVNRIRQRIRDLLGVETLEVRQSLDTPLQIRRALSQNRFVALLVDRHLRTRPRRGHVPRTPGVVPSNAHGAGEPHRRAARALLHPPDRAAAGSPRCPAARSPCAAISRATPPSSHAAQEIADQLAEQVRAHPECWYHFYRYLGRPARRIRRPRLRDSGIGATFGLKPGRFRDSRISD